MGYGNIHEIIKYNYKELKMACNGFHEANALGCRWGKRCLNVSLLTGMSAGQVAPEAPGASGAEVSA